MKYINETEISELEKNSRGWIFTLNNYTESDVSHIQGMECVYQVVGKEVAPTTGTPHLQGYMYFKSAKTGSVFKKKLSDKAHIAAALGNAEQNRVYCTKAGDFWETGTMPEQGKRSDLKKMTEDVLSRKRTVEDILEEDPMAFHVYGRTLDRVADMLCRRQQRDFMTQGIWYYGTTGVGKSYRAANAEGTKYFHKFDNNWWDNYRQEDVVIINEFRGQLTFSDLLAMVDQWPYSVSRRNRCPMPFMSKTVIITSDSPPEGVYKDVDMIRMAQLYRRFKVIFCVSQNSEQEKNYEFTC